MTLPLVADLSAIGWGSLRLRLGPTRLDSCVLTSLSNTGFVDPAGDAAAAFVVDGDGDAVLTCWGTTGRLCSHVVVGATGRWRSNVGDSTSGAEDGAGACFLLAPPPKAGFLGIRRLAAAG